MGLVLRAVGSHRLVRGGNRLSSLPGGVAHGVCEMCLIHMAFLSFDTFGMFLVMVIPDVPPRARGRGQED